MTDDDNVIRLGHKEMDQMGWPRYDGTDKKESSFGARREAVKDRILPSPMAPMAAARALVEARYAHDDGALTLQHWRGGWWTWRRSHWAELEQRAVAAVVYDFTEHAVYMVGDKVVPWEPTKHKVANLLDALAAIVHLAEDVDQPSWINGHSGREGTIVACENGLLGVASRELLPHHPHYWNAVAVPFSYQPTAPAPTRWLAFLEDLWGDDAEQVAALQEWAGYLISGRLDHQKILLVVGPTRAGKGVMARTFERLLGRKNTTAPTLNSLSGEFGLAPLLGKSLATISDARLSGRGGDVVVERLLSISGEDTITVNRKHKDQWTGKLPVRFQLMSNELPRFSDASMAVTGRFVILSLSKTWLGKEDRGLEDALADDLPGILNWALEGLARLNEWGRFTRPQATEEQLDQLRALASPVSAFVAECCSTGIECAIGVDALYAAWKTWAEDNGHHGRKTKQTLGRDLHAVLQGRLQVERPRTGGGRERRYVGIALKADL